MTSAVSVTCRENLFVIVSNQKKKRKKRERDLKKLNISLLSITRKKVILFNCLKIVKKESLKKLLID